MSVTIRVNGNDRRLDIDPEMPLLWALRDVLGLTGTKYGCGEALCGACSVHLNGQVVRSCVTPVRRAAGGEVVTIEGLSPDGNHPLQKAWVGKTPRQICEQIKDSKRNGGKSLAQIVEHNAHDKALVAWGWSPGSDREPAPGSQEQFGAIVAAWVETGAECPSGEVRR